MRFERDHDPVARGDIGDVGPDLFDDPYGLMAQDVARVEERAEHLVEVEVGAADAARGDLDDGVVGLLDDGVGYLFDPHVSLALPCQRFHFSPDPGSVSLRWNAVLALSGSTFIALPCAFDITLPALTLVLPAIRASKP